MQGPFFPDYAPGRILWAKGVSVARFEYARAYGACKICLKLNHMAQHCPDLRNMKFEDDYVYYLPIPGFGQQRQ